MSFISSCPGLKTIVGALLKSMRMLAEVILLTLFVMMVFSLFTLQVYVGILRQKCVLKIPDDVQPSHYEYSLHLKNESKCIELTLLQKQCKTNGLLTKWNGNLLTETYGITRMASSVIYTTITVVRWKT